MNNQAKIALEILIVLIIVVLVSGTTLALVNLGILKPKKGVEEAGVLNTEFIPYMRKGFLAVKEFKFCEGVREDYECIGESQSFGKPGLVFFRFIVESTTVNGEVMLVENYRIKDEEGKVLLEVDEKDNFYFEMKSGEEVQEIYFKDYLVIEEEDKTGKYVLELLMENPLLNKKVTLRKEFEIV